MPRVPNGWIMTLTFREQDQSAVRRTFQFSQPSAGRHGKVLIGSLRPKRNSMIRACHVNEVGGPRLHVTVDAAVTQALLPSIGVRQATTIFLMTSEASLSIVSSFLLLGWRLMRIVARDAPQPASAVAKTAAGVHLLHFAGEFFLDRKSTHL